LIEENNKLIADEYILICNFMEYKINTHTAEWLTSNFKFKTGWHYLIPVVQKINEIRNSAAYPLFVKCLKVRNSLVTLDIKLIYNEVIEFINWYNQQTL